MYWMNRTMSYSEKLLVQMTKEQRLALEDRARGLGISRAEAMRQALASWIDGGQAPSSGNDTVTGALDQIMERFDAIDRRLNTVEGRQKITMIRE
jgi:hypothetical protein